MNNENRPFTEKRGGFKDLGDKGSGSFRKRLQFS